MFRLIPSAIVTPCLMLLLYAAWAWGSAPRMQAYETRGILKSFDADSHEASITHDDIPGCMHSMTMSFDVPDISSFLSLQPGDRIAFRLCIEGDRTWIDHVRLVESSTRLPVLPLPSNTARELKTGEEVPDMEWTNQRGEKTRLRDLRGSAVVVTFIYSRCPLPTYCPLLNRNLSRAQTLLQQLGSGENWRMISLSLDAAHDTPSVLAAYAESLRADEKHWSFATASDSDLRRLGDAAGLEFQRSGKQINHNLRTLVIDVNGRMTRLFRGNSWTPQDLAAEMRKAMRSSH